MAINNQDTKEIHELPEVLTLQAGMMVAVDSEPTGTKSFNLTTALEGKASTGDISTLETEIGTKADANSVYTKAETDTAISAVDITTNQYGENTPIYLRKNDTTIGTVFQSSFQTDLDSSHGNNTIKLIGIDASNSTVGTVSVSPTSRNNVKNMCLFHNHPDGQETYYFVPSPITDGVLKNDSGAISWGAVNEVPSSAVADSGKVLTVDNSGVPAWAQPSSGATAPVSLYKQWVKSFGDYSSSTTMLEFDISAYDVKSAIITINVDVIDTVMFEMGYRTKSTDPNNNYRYGENIYLSNMVSGSSSAIRQTVAILPYCEDGYEAIEIKNHASGNHRIGDETNVFKLRLLSIG